MTTAEVDPHASFGKRDRLDHFLPTVQHPTTEVVISGRLARVETVEAFLVCGSACAMHHQIPQCPQVVQHYHKSSQPSGSECGPRNEDLKTIGRSVAQCSQPSLRG